MYHPLMPGRFGPSRCELLVQVQQLRSELDELRTITSAKLQQLDEELAITRLKRLLSVIHEVAHLQIKQGVPAARAIAQGLQAAMVPLPRGVAGGLARAKYAWRYDDGTWMSYDDEQRIMLEQHERMSRGGRARAKGAKRAPDGTFVRAVS